ncbi:hypothetical protein STCU_07112 [Strigomonas culicis]|uniref:Uncharacterized protein n=1 Tax=Strigomonas culicis TaxID=28005 RepID=S9U715_9TRYP|nr:hypothetical protein STCU_07112 [Strigomonas culicis]|eukprot:EPY24574.1 hypothetical protein STCU_07112 [Strigomonas culicis]
MYSANVNRSAGGRSLFHGSDPDHRYECVRVTEGVQCVICRANSMDNATWYACVEAGCGKVLCPKCFEVNEQLFETLEVVIRNPLIQYNDTSAAVHTRPKQSSYKLAPLYGGCLMEVVSSAVSPEDESLTYFRLRCGGWINSAQVVCVIPSKDFIDRLARFHLQGVQNPDLTPVPPREMIEYMQECTNLMDTNPPYGVVMASITMYPLLVTLQYPCPIDVDEENASAVPTDNAFSELADQILRFLHFVLDFVVSELECCLDDDMPIKESTMLSLYEDILAGCLVGAQDMSEKWNVALCDEFTPLFLRAATVQGRLAVFLSHNTLEMREPVVVCRPSVVTTHVNADTERSRLLQLVNASIGWVGDLVLHCTESNECHLRDLEPLRQVLTYTDNLLLEKLFCDLVAGAVDSNAAFQRRVMNLDPLEIVARVCRRDALHTEGLCSAFRVVGSIARRSARNVALASTIALDVLLESLQRAANPQTVVAAAATLFELAFNDPRTDSTSEAALERTPKRGGTGECGCTRGLYEVRAAPPYQLMYTFAVNGAVVGLCRQCAERHAPLNAVLTAEPQYAYFRCQCTHSRCRDATARPALPPPSVPATSAIKLIQQEGNAARLVTIMNMALKQFAMYHSDVLNAIGRLALRLEMPKEVILSMFSVLAQKSDLADCPYAAMAVANYDFLPEIKETLLVFPNTAIARYMLEPFPQVQGTPSKGDLSSHRKSELGLSPSPDGSSIYRSSQSVSEFRNHSALVFTPMERFMHARN